MPNFNNGTVTSVTLDEYDTLSVSGTARLQVTVGSKPQFETTSVGDLTFGPFGFITYITINATGLGSYSQQPSNNPIPVAMVDVSPAQLSAPTSTQLAITNILYQRNAPPYDIYQSNGTALIPLGGVGSVQSGALAASTTVAPNATAVQNAIAAAAGAGAASIRTAFATAILLDITVNGRTMPLVAGQNTAITSPTTLTIAAGAIEGGVCEVLLAVTSTLALPTTYPGIPAGKGVVVNGSITSGFNYRIVFGISAGDLVIFCFQQSAFVPAPVFLTQTPPAGTIGTAYSYTYAALNTTSFAVFSGTLPTGLSLNTATGVLAGTPTTAATSSFVISATGAGGTTNSTAQSVVVAAAGYGDTFNRVDSATALGTPSDSGVPWTVYGTAVFGISTNQAYVVSATGDVLALRNTASAVQDHTVDILYRAGTFCGNIVHALNDLNFVVFLPDPSGSTGWQVVSRVTGNYWTEATLAGPAPVDGTTYTTRVTVSGSALSAYVNGSLIGSCTLALTSNNTNTLVGIRQVGSNTTTRFDNQVWV